MRIRIEPPIKGGVVFDLTTDKYNFIVERMGLADTGKNAGEYVMRKEYFYATLHGAISYIVTHHLRESNATTIEGLQQEFITLRNWLADNVPEIIRTVQTSIEAAPAEGEHE